MVIKMVGFGFDVHRLAENETLILGGVSIDSTFGTVAHSDGDVLLHALMDALLGAAGLGDIGEHFPDTDIKYKNADSVKLTSYVVALLNSNGYSIVNIDATLNLEKPKISPYKNAMKLKIAEICQLPLNRVNIKATTNEKLGYIGNSEGVVAYCVAEIKIIDK